MAAAPLAGGLLMPLLLATDEKDPEFIAELRLRLRPFLVAQIEVGCRWRDNSCL